MTQLARLATKAASVDEPAACSEQLDRARTLTDGFRLVRARASAAPAIRSHGSIDRSGRAPERPDMSRTSTDALRVMIFREREGVTLILLEETRTASRSPHRSAAA